MPEAITYVHLVYEGADNNEPTETPKDSLFTHAATGDVMIRRAVNEIFTSTGVWPDVGETGRYAPSGNHYCKAVLRGPKAASSQIEKLAKSSETFKKIWLDINQPPPADELK